MACALPLPPTLPLAKCQVTVLHCLCGAAQECFFKALPELRADGEARERRTTGCNSVCSVQGMLLRRACSACSKPSRPPRWNGGAATPAGASRLPGRNTLCDPESTACTQAACKHTGCVFFLGPNTMLVMGCLIAWRACRHSSWGSAQAWEARGSRFRAPHDYAADLRHAQRCFARMLFATTPPVPGTAHMHSGLTSAVEAECPGGAA